MNSYVLMAEVFTEPELRYTPDNQNAIATFLVQFPGTRPEEAPSRLKVVGWGNLANEVIEKYHKGDRMVIEGRLNMNLVDRGGFKEKRAELTAQRIYPVSISGDFTSATASSAAPSDRPSSQGSKPAPKASVPVASPPPVSSDPQYDDIPF